MKTQQRCRNKKRPIGRPPSHQQQRGAVLVFTALSLVLIIGMAGVAIDMGRMFSIKTRLKNAIDPTALSAARTLRVKDDGLVTPAALIALAETEARQTFTHAIASGGNKELLGAGINAADVDFYYAANLSPNWAVWTQTWADVVPPEFVTAVYHEDTTTYSTFLLSVLQVIGLQNLDRYSVDAVATAAPIPIKNCNNAPIMICNQNTDTDCRFDQHGNPLDAANPDTECFGMPMYSQVCMKTGTADVPECDDLPGGHFHLVRFPGLQGKDDIKDLLSGAHYSCLGDTVPPEPGNVPIGVQKALNTRFEVQQGFQYDEIRYPPDHIAEPLPTAATITAGPGGPLKGSGYLEYMSIYSSFDAGGNPSLYSNVSPPTYDNSKFRRKMVVPVADCETGSPGASGDYDLVGFACIFLSRPVEKTPGVGNTQQIFAELHGNCDGKGEINSQIESNSVDYVLYKSPYI